MQWLFSNVTMTLQETNLIRTHSSSPSVIILHLRDKQEEETQAWAAGTVHKDRVQALIMQKQEKCSLNIRRIFLLRLPVAGGERLHSHNRTTSASTQPSGMGYNKSVKSLWYRRKWLPLCVCLIHRIEFNTIQREAFPQWPTVTSGCVGRQKVASPAQTNTDSY